MFPSGWLASFRCHLSKQAVHLQTQNVSVHVYNEQQWWLNFKLITTKTFLFYMSLKVTFIYGYEI